MTPQDLLDGGGSADADGEEARLGLGRARRGGGPSLPVEEAVGGDALGGAKGGDGEAGPREAREAVNPELSGGLSRARLVDEVGHRRDSRGSGGPLKIIALSRT
jgi:hypothetical protein